ncbi:MAG: alkaline phosphatase family protein [Flavobacteriales bacterium]|jgi:predicted AlkP superfamily pyrophosphatase or phosphodiesterase|tara:strand:- start:903 stop:1811 length:909 start_codon:yes stop_codon:yes gene_type:complete
MNIIIKISFSILILISIHSCNSKKENKVLIIGIDGSRPDAILKANTPNIDSLWKSGAYSFKAKTDEISFSGICWTGMLTGVWHNKHNVISNKYENPNTIEYPHFFNRIKEFNSELKTYSITHWAPLHKILQNGDADVALNYESDVDVANKAIETIQTEDVDAIFVHLDDVDHAGHTFGFHPENKNYTSVIEDSDKRVGEIVSSLKKRINYKNENWLILMSTDHGGSDTNHGQNIPEHTTIFYIASGNDVEKGAIEFQVNVVDIAVTALQHLGIEIKDEWNLDGKPVGLKKQNTTYNMRKVKT